MRIEFQELSDWHLKRTEAQKVIYALQKEKMEGRMIDLAKKVRELNKEREFI
jgi:hypothetical protein